MAARARRASPPTATPDAAEPILDVRALSVTFHTDGGPVEAVRDVDLQVRPGETLAIVGESGSGKSQSMMAVMGLLAGNASVKGQALYRGADLLKLDRRALNGIRGAKITMIFQEPMTSLDPLWPIERQIAEPMVYHGAATWANARPRVLEFLRLVGIPRPEERLRSYPHELSGGQRQRVMIAMALANQPDILIADEPTTALDVTIQAQILELLADLQRRFGMAIVFITHDLGIVRHFADRVAVMHRGRIVETGTIDEVFDSPREDYTRMLLAAEPEGRKPAVPTSAPMLVEGRRVRVVFRLRGPHKQLVAVDNVDLCIRRGQTVGLVGESGSGKSTLGRALLRLVPSEGAILFDGQRIDALGPGPMRPLRRHLQIVHQDPMGSLSPRLTVGEIVAEGLRVHAPELSRAERDRRVVAALEEVRLDPALRHRYPHQFSGGQRQRIAIARALILKPRFMVLDEPTSALDRSVQKEIVKLLRQIQEAHGLTYLFISHDLAVVRAVADTVVVMRHSSVIEAAPTEEIFARPREAYTRALLAAALEHKVVAREAVAD
jgi:ABC-type microcin C transport system duplicated ATPase subunit YejF